MKALILTLAVLFSSSHMAQAAMTEADKAIAQEAVNSIKYNSENSSAGTVITAKVRQAKLDVLAGLYSKMDYNDKEFAKKLNVDLKASLRRAYLLNNANTPEARKELKEISAMFLKIAKQNRL